MIQKILEIINITGGFVISPCERLSHGLRANGIKPDALSGAL